MSGILKIYHRIIPGEIKKTEEPLPEQFLNNHVKAGYYPGFAVYLSYTAYSGAKWTPNPLQSGHSIRSKVDTESAPKWTVIPGQSGHFFHDFRNRCPLYSGI